MNHAGSSIDDDNNYWVNASYPVRSTPPAPVPQLWRRLVRGYLFLQASQAIALKWGRLLRTYFGIRRLQLVFHTTGSALQDVSDAARQRARRIYPT